jgi:hypothetical protein
MTFRQQLALALIAATATIAAAGVPDIMRLGKKSPLESSSATATSTTCDKVTVAKVCVDNLTSFPVSVKLSHFSAEI